MLEHHVPAAKCTVAHVGRRVEAAYDWFIDLPPTEPLPTVLGHPRWLLRRLAGNGALVSWPLAHWGRLDRGIHRNAPNDRNTPRDTCKMGEHARDSVSFIYS